MVAPGSFNVNSPAFVPSGLMASEPKQHQPESSNQDQAQQQPSTNNHPPSSGKQPSRNQQPRGRNTNNRKNPNNSNASHRNRNQNNSSASNSNNKNASSKRHPKPKPHTSSSSNSYDTGLDDLDFPADLRDLNARGKRGQVSISHLLEFSTSDNGRQRRFSGGSNSHSSGSFRPSENSNWKKSKRRSSYSYYHQFSSVGPPDHLAFIQATCKFFLDPETPQLYSNLLTNPNQIIPMEKVVRILTKPSTCPICLEDIAKAPRMLPCGHVMCHPCLLRFLDPAASNQNVNTTPSSDFFANQVRILEDAKKPRECPLCFEHVRLQDTKPVTFSSFDAQFDTPKENTDVVMKLMFRPHVDIHNNGEDKKMLSMPVSTPDLSSEKFNSIPVVSPDALNYSRFMYPSYDYLLEQYETEIKDLETQRDTEFLLYPDDLFNLKYFNMAIESIKQSIYDLQRSTKYDPETILSAEKIAQMSLNDKKNTNSILTPEQYLESFDEKSAYYYYQTAFQSDIKYVLAPLDARILFQEFQDYKNFPSTIIVKVERIVQGHYADEHMKKKLKYLNHFPDHTEVAFIECQWLNNNKSHHQQDTKGKQTTTTTTNENENLTTNNTTTITEPEENGSETFTLSQETINRFREELVDRVKTRKEKERFENRQAKMYQKIQDKQFQDEIWGRPRVEDPSRHQEELKSFSAFPTLKKEDNNNNNTNNNATSEEDQNDSLLNNESSSSSNQQQQNINSKENEENVTQQKQQQQLQDPIKKLAATVILGNRQTKTVWGTDAVFTKSEEEALRLAQQEAQQAGWTDYSKVLELYSQKMMMESSSSSTQTENSENGSSVPNNDESSNKGSKGKKKQKRLVLMSTLR